MPPRKPVKTASEEREFVRTAPSKPIQKKQGPSIFKQVKDFFIDERTRVVAGVLIGFFTVFIAIGMISYFFTGAADQSRIHQSWEDIHSERKAIQNVTSVTGAVISHFLIQKSFGIASFSVLFFFAVISFRLLQKKLMSLWTAFFHTAFWLIFLSMVLGFVNLHFKPMTFFALGGEHGDYVSQWLSSYVGDLGNIFILLGALIAYLVISSAQTIPFFKKLFSKKEKYSTLKGSGSDLGPEVAIGTELIPEEWLENKKADENNEDNSEPEWDFEEEVSENQIVQDEPIEEEEEETIATGSYSDVTFEIEQAVQKEEDLPVDAAELEKNTDVNDDPAYSVSKLGKYDPRLDLSKYKFPTLDLLKIYGTDNETQIDMKEQHANKERITQTLQNYGIEIKTIKATVGPTITLYEIVPKDGVRISKIRNLESDIMLSLAATGIRIIAPIPGKGTIGIEVPNSDPQVVSMHSVIASKKFQESKMELPVAFGRTITNEIFMVDLTKMPHLLVAGATGQGKSVGLNAIITSLLYHKHPSELKLVLIDPKKVEFNIYSGIEKHFLAKLPDGEDAIITDTSKVVETLSSLCTEMDERYELLKKAHARNIKEYNEKFVNRQLNPEKGHRFLQYIVVIVDEFGDLIMTAGKEVEMPIARIAQLARAVGIHMIIATQRPSVNIITGVIKANFPARVAFRVSSMIDSRTIIDAPGANQLVGRGDMLFTQGNELSRVQCAFVDTPEVENIVHFIGDQQGYGTAFYLPEYVGKESEGIDASSVDLSKRDPLFEEAARLIVANQQGSTSLIQRKFSIGYNRAGRIVDQLEVAGIIGPFEGSKARQVLVVDDYHLEQILKQL